MVTFPLVDPRLIVEYFYMLACGFSPTTVPDNNKVHDGPKNVFWDAGPFNCSFQYVVLVPGKVRSLKIIINLKLV